MNHIEDRAMTVKDVAEYLNVDEKTIYRLVQRGDMPAFKVLGSWRFELADLRDWVATQKQATAASKAKKQKG
jgi:excisionase family DNA binding protein